MDDKETATEIIIQVSPERCAGGKHHWIMADKSHISPSYHPRTGVKGYAMMCATCQAKGWRLRVTRLGVAAEIIESEW